MFGILDKKEGMLTVQINTLYSLDQIADFYYINNDLQIININTGKIKKQTLGKRGYYYVTLSSIDKQQKKVPVHKIVALAFIENLPYEVINHKDGNKLNNEIINLEFVSQQQNCLHAWNNGLSKRHEKIFEIMYQDKIYDGTMKDLSKILNIPRATLYDLFYKNKNSKIYPIKYIREK